MNQIMQMVPQGKEVTENYFQTANKLKHEGKLEAAVAFYSKAIEHNSQFYLYHHNMGEVLALLGRWDEAATSYRMAIELNPKSAWSYHNLGDVWVKLGHFDQAILFYSYAIELNKKYYGFYNKYGQTFYQLAIGFNLESLQEDIELCKRLDKSLHSDKKQDSLTELCYLDDELFLQISERLNNEDFVEKAYVTYLKRTPDMEGKNHYIRHLGERMTRQELVSGFRQSPEFASLLKFSLSSFCLREAIAAYRRAIELNPNSSKSSDSLGKALLQMGKELAERGQIDEAIENYQQAIPLPGQNILAEAHYAQGNAMAQQGKIDEAIKSYRQAVAIKSDWAEVHFNLGTALFKQDKLEEATDRFQKAADIQPDWAQAHIQLGNTLLKQDKLEESRASLRKGLALEPNSAPLHTQVAYFFLESGQFDDAIACYKKAIAIQPDAAELYLGLGTAFLQYGKHDEGVASFQQAIALKPDWIHTYLAMGSQLFISGKIDEANQAWHAAIEAQNKFAKEHQLDTLQIRLLDPRSWLLALGHIACLDVYLKIMMLGWKPAQKIMMLVTPNTKVPNRSFLNYWSQYIEFVSDPSQMPISGQLANYITDYYWAATLPNGKTLMHSTQAAAVVYKRWEAENRPPLLSLSASDTEQGWDCLQKLGVPKNAWFVGLHVREPGFHGKWNKVHPATRDADINTYLLAVESITARGGWVIRMGDPNMAPLPKMDQVLDYAHSEFKSDWMDIFLCATCYFFLGTSSGLAWVPPTFGVPCALTNWTPIGLPPAFPKNIFIPKLYWSDRENRYLNFLEIFDSPMIYKEFSKYFDSINVSVMDNTAEEINDLVLEMLESIEGTIKYTKEDEYLQQQFHKQAVAHGSYRGSRLGQAFLRKYAYLLP
ncbi:TIGR04372 family glycosyltransferase [Microcoleus sp. BROC3]|uniref:TIGR04372 family glycosyltransferase n=1 Tax=Microcoleus sp. BROC3 TaxID=3055323 RepID=UPI002FD2284A